MDCDPYLLIVAPEQAFPLLQLPFYSTLRQSFSVQFYYKLFIEHLSAYSTMNRDSKKENL